MSSPAASWALMMQATASVYCSRNMVSPIAALNERPFRLRSNHSGRGYDPVIAVGSTRSRVVLSIATSSLSHDARTILGAFQSKVSPQRTRRTARRSQRNMSTRSGGNPFLRVLCESLCVLCGETLLWDRTLGWSEGQVRCLPQREQLHGRESSPGGDR